MRFFTLLAPGWPENAGGKAARYSRRVAPHRVRRWRIVDELDEEGYRFESHRVDGRGVVRAWVVALLVGSLLEVAYLYRWFGFALREGGEAPWVDWFGRLSPVGLCALALLISGHLTAAWLGLDAARLLVPVYIAIILFALEGMPGRLKALLTLAAFAASRAMCKNWFMVRVCLHGWNTAIIIPD